MATKVQLEGNQLRFEEFPTHSIEYFKESPKSSRFHLQVIDTQTEKVLSVFLKCSDLQEIGISLTLLQLVNQPLQFSNLLEGAYTAERLLKKSIQIISDQLDLKYLQFFENISFANRVIIRCIHEGTDHLSKNEGIPGIYLDRREDSEHVFINLKKTPPLGLGSYGKIRKVLWLTAPDEKPQIVAKKVLRYHEKAFTDQKEKYKEYVDQFNQEIAALNTFSERKGIISMISGGFYKDKYAVFMPFYKCSLDRYLWKPSSFKMTLDEQLDLISQWLEGLATISEKGIHGDLSAGNLLLKRDKNNKIEGVITDFGAFRPYGKEEYGLTTLSFGSPEYHMHKLITSKQDVWALGLSLQGMFSKNTLPYWCWDCEEDMLLLYILSWISTLTPGWCLDNFIDTTPPFLKNLINDMLDPRPDHRLSAKDAYEQFLKGDTFFTEVKPLDEIEKGGCFCTCF